MIINNISVPHNSVRSDVLLTHQGTPLMTIGRGSYIVDASIQQGIPSNLCIGQFCSLATDVLFMLQVNKDFSRVTTSADKLVAPFPETVIRNPHTNKGQIIIQNDVWVGHGVTIMAGVTVRNGAIIAANSHVVKDVPPYAIVGGNPAKVIGYRFTEEQIADLQSIAWWDWSDELIAERKIDFSLPINEFIEKYANRTSFEKVKDENQHTMLFIPDFGEPLPFWQRVIRAYCDIPVGMLFIYIPQDNNTQKHIDLLEEFLAENYGGDGDIYVHVGQIRSEEELFMQCDYYITSRSFETVRRTCFADRHGVKIISCADVPLKLSAVK